MRMLMKVQIPTEAGSKGIKDGTLPDVIRKTLESLHPEAADFTTMGGQRTMIAVFDMIAAADMPHRRAAVHGAGCSDRIHAVHECGRSQDRTIRNLVAGTSAADRSC
jgi:hypothetical protein